MKFPTQQLAQDIRSTLRAKSQEFVALHAPMFGANANKYLADCVDTGWVSSLGKYVDQFERSLEERTGAKHAIAVCNGTAALQVALQIAGVQAGDEVLLPSLTFVASANAIKYCQAEPHFVDIEETSLGIDCSRMAEYLSNICEMENGICINKKTGRRIRALLTLYAFGHPYDIEGAKQVCDQFNLHLIEDAAEAIGTLVNGRHAGTFGTLGTLSFNGNKTITTGGGGAILTDDSELAANAKHITTTAKVPHGFLYEHDQVGFNYRMPNINAALGVSQLEDLTALLDSKRKLAERFISMGQSWTEFEILKEPENCKSNYWLNNLILRPDLADQRDSILTELNQEHGVQARAVWNPMHTLPMYTECERMPLNVTEDLAQRIISLPSSPYLEH